MKATRIAIAVVEHQGRFLIGPRGADVTLAGKWEFPGGKVEAHETIQDAAVRECREETGCQIEVIGHLLTHTEEYDFGSVELHFFRCRLAGEDTLKPPFRWVPRGQLQEFDFPSGNDELLALLVGDT